MLILAIFLSLLIGLVLGLLGGGGSILTVPIFIGVLHMEAEPAISTSLFVVGITSATAAFQHAYRSNVRWREGLLFGGFGVFGAFMGGWLSKFLPAWLTLSLFSVLMVVTAIAMLRGHSEEPLQQQNLLKVTASGLGVGTITGVIGAGGGFLVVPALSLFSGVPLRQAIGTSTMVVAMQSFAALAGRLSHSSIDFELAAWSAFAAVLGSLGGVRLGLRINQESLRRGFAYFVLLVAVFLFYQQLISR